MKNMISVFLFFCTFTLSAHAGLFDFLGSKDKERVTPKLVSGFAQFKWELKSDENKHCPKYFGIQADYGEEDSKFTFGRADKSGSINGSKGSFLPLTLTDEGKIKKKSIAVSVQGDLTFAARMKTKMKDGIAIIDYNAETRFGQELARVAGQESTDISFKVKLNPLKDELVYINKALKKKDSEGPCVYRKSVDDSASEVVDSERVFGAHEKAHSNTADTEKNDSNTVNSAPE